MTIGERIHQARLMANFSQRKLAEKANVSPMAISKYERDLDVPGSKVLIRLAQALGVKIEFFLRPQLIGTIEPKFRKRVSLSAKAEKVILSRVTDWLERYLEIEGILFEDPICFQFEYPQGFPSEVESFEDVERAAKDLREVWNLGMDPIENLTDLLETKGIKVGVMDADLKFDACTFQDEDNSITAIITRSGIPGDRQRFNIAHELGHLMLKVKGLDEEKAAHRFAASFLAPEVAARLDLRDKRTGISLYELHHLKHKYGLSMQAWIYRARDLSIISKANAEEFFRMFSSKGWRQNEPGDPIPSEVSNRFERLVISALADGIISESRAGEFLGMPVRDFMSNEAETHGRWLTEVCN